MLPAVMLVKIVGGRPGQPEAELRGMPTLLILILL